jgi:putative flavoprotein involved in K+ transport
MLGCLKERNLDHNEPGARLQMPGDRSVGTPFCLVTPNWQCQLPNYPYQGNEPEGFHQKGGDS